MNKYCTVCGTKIKKNLGNCPVCGSDIKIQSINIEINRQERKIYRIIKNRLVQISIVCFGILFIFLSSNMGRLTLARINVKFENYTNAMNVIKKVKSPKYKMYYNYCALMDSVKNLTKCNPDDYENAITNIGEKLSADYDSDILSKKEKENVKNIEFAMEYPDSNPINDITDNINYISQFGEIIKKFKNGEGFSTDHIYKEVIKYKEGLDKANNEYKNKFSEGIPYFDLIESEMNHVLSKMQEKEGKNLYFSVYNTKYRDIYTEENKKIIIYNYTNMVYYETAAEICSVVGIEINKLKKPEEKKIIESNATKEKEYTGEINETYHNQRGVYDEFSQIPDFGNYLNRDVYYNETFDYFYKYVDEDDIDSVKNEYFDALTIDYDFKKESEEDTNSAIIYQFKNKKYSIRFIDDYALDHIEIHIKNKR